MLSTIFSFSLGDVYLNKNIVKAEGEKKVVNVDRIYKELNGYIDKKTTENLIYKVTNNNITTEADLEKTEALYTIHSKEYNDGIIKRYMLLIIHFFFLKKSKGQVYFFINFYSKVL